MKALPPPEKTDPFAAISQPAEAPAKRGRGRPRKAERIGTDGGIHGDRRTKAYRAPKRSDHQPSPEMRKTIANMAGYGLDVLTISKLAGIDPTTIYRHYRHEMQTASAQKDLMVLQSAFLKAVGGPEQNWEKADAGTQRWWIERRQGWQAPPQRIINERMDLSRLSDRQLDELERIMEAAALDSGRDQAGEG
jgi:hypothetical protein